MLLLIVNYCVGFPSWLVVCWLFALFVVVCVDCILSWLWLFGCGDVFIVFALVVLCVACVSFSLCVSFDLPNALMVFICDCCCR